MYSSAACARLSLYENPDNGQVIRVNYAALNVEEFGSVYEGLLEYEPVFYLTDRESGRSSLPLPRATSGPPPAPTTRRMTWCSR